MHNLGDKTIKMILEYNTMRPYFGKLTADNLATAYARLKTSEKLDVPLKKADVPVGLIDGNVICNALWYEMSYNLVRFGTVSPFMYNGKNNIFHFCNHGAPTWSPVAGREVLERVRYELIRYMQLNAMPNGQWCDVVQADKRGNVAIAMENGHSDNMYKILAHLRNSIKFVTRQNMTDFSKYYGSHRPAIMAVIAVRHPHGLRSDATEPLDAAVPYNGDLFSKSPVVPVKKTSHAPEQSNDISDLIAQERIDDQLDSLQITIDNRDNVSTDLYNQAVQDLIDILGQNNIRQK